MMCGLLVPTSGQALVLGMDLKESSGKARQHLGYMAQKFSLYGNRRSKNRIYAFSLVCMAYAVGRRTVKSPV